MIHKIAGVGRTPMALEIAWRRHEIAAHVAQPPRPQGGIRQRGNAQSCIETGTNQIDHRVAQMQVDGNLRVFCKELRQERHYFLEAEGHRHGKAQQPARRRRLRVGLALGRLAFGKDAGGTIQDKLPGVGERQAARCD